MIGGEIGRPVRTRPGPGRRSRRPTAGPGSPASSRGSESNSASTRSRHGLGSGLDLGGLVVVAQDPAVEARDGDVDARGAEVRDEDVARLGAERQLARRPTARARPDLALRHQAAVDQLADALGDDGPTEAGPGDELGPRPRATEPDLVEDRDQRVERLVREWRVRPAAPCREPIDTRVLRPFGRSTFALDRTK